MPAWLLDLFARYGYAVVFGGVFLENTGLPVPGETALLAGAALAHAGQLSLVWVIVTAIAGATLGDNLGFFIGRRGGRRIAERHGWRIGLTRERLVEFDRFFERHGPKTVFVARFITGLRVVCAVLAGGSGMPWPMFLFYNASGAVVWCTRDGVRRLLAGVQLGHARALDRPHRLDRARAGRRGWYHRLRARATESSLMITLASGLSYLDLQFLRRAAHHRHRRSCTGPAAWRSSIPGRRARCRRCAPGSSAPGIAMADVRSILLTHIHLDHAGATGTLVRENPSLRVYVHEKGAPHMVDPSKLMASATRLWGDEMDRLWGEMRPVPAEHLIVLRGGERITAGGRDLDVAYTPGHASHHVSYFSADTGIAFVGDTAGVRLQAGRFIMPPTPPPDIDLEAWRDSLARIARLASGDALRHALRPVRAGRPRISPRWRIISS